MKLFDITRAIHNKKGRFCDLRESKIEVNLERGASAGTMPTSCMAGKVPLSLGIGQWAREGGLGPSLCSPPPRPSPEQSWASRRSSHCLGSQARSG